MVKATPHDCALYVLGVMANHAEKLAQRCQHHTDVGGYLAYTSIMNTLDASGERQLADPDGIALWRC